MTWENEYLQLRKYSFFLYSEASFCPAPLASTLKHFAKPPQTPKKFSLFLFYIVYSLAVFLCLWFKFFNKIAEIQPHKINIPKLQI